MAKTKYNWVELKQEYLKSDVMDIVEFFRLKFGSDTALVKSGNYKDMVVGWKRDKEKEREEAAEMARKERLNALREKYRVDEEELFKAKKLTIQAMALKLNSSIMRDEKGNAVGVKLTPKAMETLLKNFKNELGEDNILGEGSKFFMADEVIIDDLENQDETEI
jgi:hypothetical protein